MAVFVVSLVLLLSFAGHSDAAYCVCNSGLSDSVLQKNIDYACGAGADCTPIQQNGACYNPNTVKDHCSYAVNSYYQKKGQSTGSCDFQGTATVTQNAPSAGSGCLYPTGPSGGGVGTPSSSPTIGGTPTTPNMGGTTTPGMATPGAVPGSATNPGIGLGPTGSGFGSTDSAANAKFLSKSSKYTLVSISAALLLSGLVFPSI